MGFFGSFPSNTTENTTGYRWENTWTIPERATHYSYRDCLGSGRCHLYSASTKEFPGCIATTMAFPGGTTEAAHVVSQQESDWKKVGLMVAANSGRPCGACGDKYKLVKIHSGHNTQEEDVVSNCMMTMFPGDPEAQNDWYRATVCGEWGMETLNVCSVRTKQGVDYVKAKEPKYYSDAYTTPATVSANYDDKMTDVTLVFSAGPNAGARGSLTGSMTRTLNKIASQKHNYAFFRECVKEAVRTGLDAMVGEGCTVALVARLSCGIYAGPHKKRINEEFETLVNEILAEEVIPGRTRSTFFEYVLIPDKA